MDLKSQLSNFELSKELEKLGIKQDSLWYWVEFYSSSPTKKNTDLVYCEDLGLFANNPHLTEIKAFSAFTCAELGEMLPWCVKKKSEIPYYLEIKKVIVNVDEDEFQVGYFRGEKRLVMFLGKSLANALAKMLIYLKKNGFI